MTIDLDDPDAATAEPPTPDADLDVDDVPEPARVDRWVWRLPYDRPPVLINDVSSPMALGSKRKKIRNQLGTDLGSVFHPWGWDLVEVELVWFKKDNRAADPDGMATTVKPALDALVDAGVLPDDGARHVHRVSERIVLRTDDAHHDRGARVLLVVHQLERREDS